ETGDDDDYSASATAILEKGRGDSWRRRSSKRRRSSSPLSVSLRRRSSVFTTGSGEISIEDDEQEQIFQNMRIHKEVVAHIKYQPWPIQKKLRLVQAAKSYIKQHEGQIQERLAQRRSARDILARINILLIHNWNYVKREFINLANNMIPWEPRIKRIESHFGTVVASYFTFLRWMAVNSKQSKLSEKDDDCIFTWKMFTSWDFMIGNPETAHNRTSSIILGFKEALLEEAEKTREEGRNWKLFSIRIFSHFNVIWLLASSVYAVIKVVGRSDESSLKEAKSWWQQNEVTVVITLIGTVYPIVFDGISYLEKYHPRKALRLQLARIMVLNLLNLYSFIFATFSVIHGKSTRLSELKKNLTKMITNISESRQKVSVVPTKPSFTTESLVVAALILTNVSTHPHLTENPTTISYPTVLSDNYSNFTEHAPILINGEPVSNNDFFNATIPESNKSSSSFFNEEYEDELNRDKIGVTLYEDNNTLSDALTPSVSENCLYDCVTNASGTEDYSTTVAIDLTQERSTTPLSTTSIPIKALTNEKNIATQKTTKSISYNVTTSAKPGGKYDLSQKRTTLTYNGTTQIDSSEKDLSFYIKYLDRKSKKELHNLCWETMFGQELVKLTVMDLLMTVLGIIMGDFFRALFVRFMNKSWCWDLEKKFPQYADFKMAENILHLVNNQGMVWMGMFFSPGLPLINLIKLVVMMYMRSWAVLTCNIPHEVVFRASRSNNFYFALLLIMLFLCVLPVGYALVWIEPSWHCGPFSNYNKIYHLFTSSLKQLIPGETFHRVLDYIASPAIVIPLLMLLILIIYYLLSLTNALRETNDDLKA
ncbi:unnamed protein product, partial [Nezara viridula]